MITFTHKGNLRTTQKFFRGVSITSYLHIFEKYGHKGVEALSSATPIDSGKTKDSWSYTIKRTKNGVTITWNNSHIDKGVPIAIILQYGHATRNGGYVQGRDYINPTMRPIFDSMTKDLWREVTAL
jgi:hypothetical protein